MFRFRDATSDGSVAEKNEKFCSTLARVICDNDKPLRKSKRLPNSCINYENINHHMPLFTCVRTDFARAITATGTSSAYESGRGTTGARY